MAKNGRATNEEAWRNAKKICRLNVRQVQMARALGMNPKKLPRLRPGPQQHWKLPVGEFIEECYRKRFGGDPLDRRPYEPEPGSLGPPTAQRDVAARERVSDTDQVGDLVCYFMNLADDLEAWLRHGTIAPEVLPQVIQELREILEALEAGAPVSPIPGITSAPRPARHASSRQWDREYQSDDEIPF